MPVFSFLCVEIYRACWNIIVSLLEIPTVQQRIVSAQRASNFAGSGSRTDETRPRNANRRRLQTLQRPFGCALELVGRRRIRPTFS
jgi:hypothetical protein